MLDMNAPIDDVLLAFLDVETTGLQPHWGDRICEIAVLRYQGEEVLDSLQCLVNPGRPMGAGAYAVHGISDEMLRDAPPFSEVAADLLELLEDAVLVGHNTPFDLGFLDEELARVGIVLPSLPALDTLRLARRHYRFRSYSLGQLALALGVEVGSRAHRAMVDVLLTRGVFRCLVSDLQPRGVRCVDDYIKAQGGPLRQERRSRFDLPAVLQEALRGNRLLHLRYLSEHGEETVRFVRPISVRERGGQLSLVGHCYLRDALRSFRLDRILEMDLVMMRGHE